MSRALGCDGIGDLYSKGLGVPQDDTRALQYYELGCQYDNDGSCANAGRMIERQANAAPAELKAGLQEKASDRYRRAFDLSNADCRRGDRFHCSRLGDAYREGKGVERNLDEAGRLYTIGCDGQMKLGCDGLRALDAMKTGSPIATQGADAGSATPTGDGADVCARVRCRPETTFRVADETKVYVVKVPPTPYAGADALSVYPGDDYFVTADERGGGLRNFRHVDPPRQPKNVLHIQFTQEKDKTSGRFMMVLTIQSFFSRRLVYHALGNHPARPQREYFKTSTCPLGPMMRLIELWPTPMSFLKLTDFRFREGRQVCEYY